MLEEKSGFLFVLLRKSGQIYLFYYFSYEPFLRYKSPRKFTLSKVQLPFCSFHRLAPNRLLETLRLRN